jgi:hypothetical protein
MFSSCCTESAHSFRMRPSWRPNPKWGFAGCVKARRDTQRKLPTPGTNRKVWISGPLEFSTGSFRWVVGERKNDELFLKLLEELRRVYSRFHCY